MTDRETMQMAIEALLLPSMKTQQMLIQRDKAIIALRRALEQSEQQQADPVAWGNGDELDNLLDDRTATVSGIQSGWRRTPLYTHSPQRKPLTHEQRFDLLTEFEAYRHSWHALGILIDMVEAAHGIKETP